MESPTILYLPIRPDFLAPPPTPSEPSLPDTDDVNVEPVNRSSSKGDRSLSFLVGRGEGDLERDCRFMDEE